MIKLALLRHGPTDWNAAGRVQGHIDVGLSQKGLAEMSGVCLPIGFGRVFVSPMLRARQTAQALTLNDPVVDGRLIEQHWGIWEGLTREEILSRHGGDAFVKAGLGTNFRPGGGESTGEMHERVAGFLKMVAAQGKDGVAVTHLGVLRSAYTLATGWDMATPMPAQLDVSKILLLALDDEGVPRIEGLNLGFTARKTGPA